MKTYPITDHVPESELLAITQAGAERWLTAHGWTREAPGRYPHWWSAPGRPDDTVVLPKEGQTGRIEQLAFVVGVIAFWSHQGPRTIIAEMQAASRIVEAGRKVASR